MYEYDEHNITDPLVCSDDDEDEDVQAAFGDEDTHSRPERNKIKKDNFERKVWFVSLIGIHKYCSCI